MIEPRHCGPRARKRGAAHSPRPRRFRRRRSPPPPARTLRPRPTPPSCGACPCRPRAGWRVRPEPHGRPPCRRRRGACRPLLPQRARDRCPEQRVRPATSAPTSWSGADCWLVSVLQPSPGTLRSGACTSSPPLSVSWAGSGLPSARGDTRRPGHTLGVEQDGERTRVQ